MWTEGVICARVPMASDRIHIRGLRLSCIIGTEESERQKPQDLNFDLSLSMDLGQAGQSDRLEDTLDYASLADKVSSHVKESSYYLVERLAEAVADICLSDTRVKQVRVILQKPGALSRALSAGVEIVRTRGAG